METTPLARYIMININAIYNRVEKPHKRQTPESQKPSLAKRDIYEKPYKPQTSESRKPIASIAYSYLRNLTKHVSWLLRVPPIFRDRVSLPLGSPTALKRGHGDHRFVAGDPGDPDRRSNRRFGDQAPVRYTVIIRISGGRWGSQLENLEALFQASNVSSKPQPKADGQASSIVTLTLGSSQASRPGPGSELPSPSSVRLRGPVSPRQ